MPALLSIQSLGRRIASRWIWRGISCDVFPGDRIGVSGKTGSGKSLFLRTLAGLDRADAGTISLRGQDIRTWHMPQYRKHVLYLHQKPHMLTESVQQELAVARTFKINRSGEAGTPPEADRLQAFHLDNAFLQKATATLSGGEMQIVAFLRGLALHPTVLLLDEPTASMDPDTTAEFEAALDVWMTEVPERAFILISHDARQIGRIATRVLSLEAQTA